MSEPLRVYVIAGEPSGDQLGALLIRALRRKLGADGVRVAGVGGERMAEAGVTSVAPIADLAVMGLFEVLPGARRILSHLKTTLADIKRFRPDVVVTIDSWGFTGRVNKALAKAARTGGEGPLRVHYVAPMVWVYKKSRAKKVASIVDLLLVLWPFEPDLFARYGLATRHVGHAALETGAGRGEGDAFRERHGLGAEEDVLLVLPGSRRREVRVLMPIFRGAVERLSKTRGPFRVVIPTLDHLRSTVENLSRDWPVAPLIVTGAREKEDAFAAARAALAASGTISLELALAGVPHLIAYRINPLSAALLRRLVLKGARFANMINVLADRAVIPEMLQEKATPEALATQLAPLLDDEAAREAQRAGMREAVARLGSPSGAAPSDSAAEAILNALKDRRDKAR